MSTDTLKMLKKVLIYDAVTTALLIAVSMVFFREYAVAAIIGLLISIVNFFLNTIITNYSMKIAGGAFLTVLGALGRVAIAGVFAVILYRGSMYNIAAYLIGYSLHYVSIIIGAIGHMHK